MGFTGIDAAADVRDIWYDLTHWEPTWEHFMQTLLDSIGLIPMVGALKNIDEAADLIKHSDDIIDGVGDIIKRSDEPKVPSMRHSEGVGNTALSDWTGKTGELAETSPVKIPDNAAIKSGTKAAGYDQISYKWNDGVYKYEARWHTKTPGAPAGQGNTWVVERITPGTSTGQKAITHILTGNGQWTTKFEWQQAITAYQNEVATEAQKALLQGGHWLAP